MCNIDKRVVALYNYTYMKHALCFLELLLSSATTDGILSIMKHTALWISLLLLVLASSEFCQDLPFGYNTMNTLLMNRQRLLVNESFALCTACKCFRHSNYCIPFVFAKK